MTDNKMEIESPVNDNELIDILYNPGETLELEDKIGNLVNVYILSKHLTLNNEQVKGRQIWGSECYTGDSDLVCILQHTGLFTLKHNRPDFYALKVVLSVLPGQSHYESSENNNLKSKTWKSHSFSLQPIEAIQIDEKDDLVESLKTASSYQRGKTQKKSKNSKIKNKNRRRNDDGELEIDSEVSFDIYPDTFLLFNLSNDLCFRYNLKLICDRGVDPRQWTSYRLKFSVLMLETDMVRYELSTCGTLKEGDKEYDAYRWAKVKNPMQKSREWMKNNPIPLPESEIEIIKNGLDWSQIEWGTSYVRVDGVNYNIKKLFWIKKSMGEPVQNESVQKE